MGVVGTVLARVVLRSRRLPLLALPVADSLVPLHAGHREAAYHHLAMITNM